MSDYIKREDAHALLCQFCIGGEICIHEGVCNAEKALANIPAADVVERKRGQWELDSDNLPVCSECGEIALQRIFVKVPHLIQDVRMVKSNFCPNCGADMREEI